MVDPEGFLKAALQLHGHDCPELILGLRAGAAAMNWLGVARSVDGELLALVQFPGPHCFADGVQAITGCALAKGNVRVQRGPLGLTLVEQGTCRAVRVAARLGVSPSGVPNESMEAFRRRLLHAPQTQFLSVSAEFRYGRPRCARGTDRRGIDRGQGRPAGRGLTSKP